MGRFNDAVTSKLVDEIPVYDRFKEVDELEESSRSLALKYPDCVEWREIGCSSEGRPITSLIIGEGDQTVFMYGFTHPNEPIGSMTLDLLASKLAVSPELRRQFGFRFVLAKAIDVDGAKLNEGWFRGPFDLVTYAENYYRPPPNEQAEWTFPIDYKTLHWHTPIPETKALVKIVDEFKPAFTYVLHNADFCGVYYYVSHNLPSAYSELKSIPLAEGLPLHRGEPPDEPYLHLLDEGIYHDYGASDEYEFLSRTLGGDPASKINYGTDSYEYIKNKYGGFCLTCELPHFYDERIQDTNPTSLRRRDLLLEGLKIEGQTHELLKQILEGCHELLDESSRIYRSVRYFQDQWNEVQQTTRALTDGDASNRPASVAEAFDLVVLRKFAQMPALGMMLRLIKDAEQRTGHTKLPELHAQTRSRLLQLNETIKMEANPRAIPIQKLVRIQLKSALVCLKNLNL